MANCKENPSAERATYFIAASMVQMCAVALARLLALTAAANSGLCLIIAQG